MTTDANIQLGFARVGAEFKVVKQLISGLDTGSLDALSTTAKQNLVAAINEINSAIQSLVAGGVTYRGGLAGTADLTSDSTGNAYLDGASEVGRGDLFKITSPGSLTVSDGSVTVSAGDNIYIAEGRADSAITVADIDVIDNSESVTSVAGKIGAVILNTDDVTELGASNLYFTAARALATTLTGFVATAGSVTADDTVLSAMNKVVGNHDQLLTDLGPLTTDYVSILEAALT